MNKVKNKGYMLVELIVSAVIAFVVAYTLMNTTMKMVNKNNDYYVENKLLVDKNIITKEIMDDVNNPNLELKSIDSTNGNVKFTFSDNTEKTLSVNENAEDNSITIKYGNISKTYEKNNINVSKTIDTANDTGNKAVKIKIPVYTNYSDENYGVDLSINYNDKEIDTSAIPFTYKNTDIYNYESNNSNYSITQRLPEKIERIHSCEIMYDNNDDNNNGDKSTKVECSIVNDGNNNTVKFDFSNGSVTQNRDEICTDNSNREIKDKSTSISYSCNRGDSLSGTTCSYSYTDSTTVSGSCTSTVPCKNGHLDWSSSSKSCTNNGCPSGYHKSSYSCDAMGSYDNNCSSGVTDVQSCTNYCEGTFSGSYSAEKNVTKYCSSGYTEIGDKCYKCNSGSLDSNNDCSMSCTNTYYLFKVQIKYK